MRLIVEADCVQAMSELAEASVDAIVCDPPYHLTFMGRAWDHAPTGAESQAMHLRWAREALRVLEPGGHLLAFGGTRTYHRLACAIEDAGFEIRDSIAWQHMEPVFCGCDRVGQYHTSNGHGDMHGMREAVQDVPAPAPEGQGADVLSSMQRQASRPRVGEARPQGSGGTQDAAEASIRSGQPSMEGRGDVLAEGGELPSDQVRPSASVGAADGSQGRVHHGASASDGAADRASVDAGGGGPSPRPQSAEQRDHESGAVAVEWIPQGGGAWPGCPRCGKPLAPPFFGGPLIWEYGSGFPKSLDVSKAIDRAAGAEREVVDQRDTYTDMDKDANTFMASPRLMDVTAPATPEVQQWQGWGTALKPAHEPIVMARKPLAGTVARNVLEHGTGAINVDGCRIGTEVETWLSSRSWGAGYVPGGDRSADRTEATGDMPPGRWPANVLLDERAAEMLDEQTGTLTSGKEAEGGHRRNGDKFRTAYGDFAGTEREPGALYGDSGGASRFLYVAKSSSAERNAGLGGAQEGAERNSHPT